MARVQPAATLQRHHRGHLQAIHVLAGDGGHNGGRPGTGGKAPGQQARRAAQGGPALGVGQRPPRAAGGERRHRQGFRRHGRRLGRRWVGAREPGDRHLGAASCLRLVDQRKSAGVLADQFRQGLHLPVGRQQRGDAPEQRRAETEHEVIAVTAQIEGMTALRQLAGERGGGRQKVALVDPAALAVDQGRLGPIIPQQWQPSFSHDGRPGHRRARRCQGIREDRAGRSPGSASAGSHTPPESTLRPAGS